MIGNLKIGTRLTLGFALVLVFLVVNVGIGLQKLDVVTDDLETIIQQEAVNQQLTNDLVANAYRDAQLNLEKFIVDSQADRDRLTAMTSALVEQADATKAQLEENLQSPEHQRLLAEIDPAGRPPAFLMSATSLSSALSASCQDRCRSARASTQACAIQLSVEPCEVRCM